MGTLGAHLHQRIQDSDPDARDPDARDPDARDPDARDEGVDPWP